MDIAGAFAEMSAAFRDEGEGPYWPAYIVSQGKMQFDNGGSLVPLSTAPWKRDCTARVESAGTVMRAQEGFAETDMAIVIPAGSLSGPISTDDVVQIRSGPDAGRWSVQSVRRSSAGAVWELRGRRA